MTSSRPCSASSGSSTRCSSFAPSGRYSRLVEQQTRASHWRIELGEAGERAVADQLVSRGWSVTDLNAGTIEPNVDLIGERSGRTIKLQVKTYNDYRWISGGGVNPGVCAGTVPLFNRVEDATHRCTHVVCVTPASPGDRKVIRGDWRHFVMPVGEAERLFRINVESYFNQLKSDGTPRAKSGAVQDFVGPGTLNSKVVLDHHQDYAPYEDAWDRLG